MIMTLENKTIARKKNNRMIWILGCGSLIVISLCIISFVLLGGFAGIRNLTDNNPEVLNIKVNTPAVIDVGKPFNISLLISNQGNKKVTINEVRFPDEMINLVSLIEVRSLDETLSQNDNPTNYSLNLDIAPNGKQTIEFFYEAINPGMIDSTIEVATINEITPIEFNLTVSPENITSENQEETPAQPISNEVIPYKSVVQIVALIEMDGQLTEGWTGSGTIISEDGLILTNAHVVLSDRYYQVVDLIVAITVAQDLPPQQMFYADILQADANLDLAVIKVRSDIDGGPANFADLNIPPVLLGDSQSLGLGEELIIIGYPGIGGETITLTRGEVSGFTSQEQYGNRAYIKTSATFAGGNSGGLAATQKGEIIGIPTQLGSGDINVDIVDCRRLADTNRDGLIDESDNCVPTGGFINALRPINLAIPLIEAAKAGEINIVENISTVEHEEYEQEGELILYDEFFNNVNNWSLGQLQDAFVDIREGQLTIDLFTENFLVYSTLPDTYANIGLGVDISVINPAFDGDFGFICGYQDENNFIGLEISEDSFYSIWAYENDQYISLVDWTFTDQIPSEGPYALIAYCGSDLVALGVNEILLAETVYENYKPGLVGLVAGTFESPNLSVGFDNFLIIQP
jgi:S1-C subfamily serine protease